MIIRKSGWLVALVLLAVMFALVYLFAGFAIRLGLIYTLEKAAGAEVNIDDVSVSLAPLALEIEDLQITDKNKPTHNTVSFARARAALEVWPALLGYHVINDLSIDGLGYGRERRSPGKVYRGELANAEEQIDLTDMLKLDLPDVQELIARANLQSQAKGKALQELIGAQKQQLADLQAQLPKPEKLAEIQAQIKTLTDSKIENAADLASKAEQLKNLQETLKAERDKVRQIQQALAQIRTQLQQSVQELRDAGVADWQQLQQLANLRDGGIAPLSQILLGDFWGKKIGQIEGFYRLVKPYIPDEGGKGEPAAAPEPVLPNRILPLPRQPYPDFWIKNARVNWLIGGGEATVSLQDVTAQHHLIDAATRFSLDVENLPQLAAFELKGDFAILKEMITNLSWQLEGFKLGATAIGIGENLLNLTGGLIASSGSMKLVDNAITQQAQIVLQQPDFTAVGNKYLQQLAQLLDQQFQIPLNLSVKGQLSDPEVSVRSSLDRVIGDALLGEAKAKLASFEGELRGKLDAQLQQQLGGQADWLAALDAQDGQLNSLQQNIEQMLNAKLADVKSGAADRLKESLLKRRGSE